MSGLVRRVLAVVKGLWHRASTAVLGVSRASVYRALSHRPRPEDAA